MSSEAYQTDLDQVIAFLYSSLSRNIDPKALAWLDTKRIQIGGGPGQFFMAFSAAPRFVGKADLDWSSKELKTADNLRSGWNPYHWSRDQTARTLLLLSLPVDNVEGYLKTLDQVFAAADVAELVALYQSLPLLPYPEQHRLRAAEGIRSNMSTVFDAVALRNPYPSEYFEEQAWNQVILKAVFIGSPLHLIIGLEQRANAELARMLIDYVHERWAADRQVTPELWRLVGPFADPQMLEDLSKVLAGSQPMQQQAAALALSQCPLPQARKLLGRHPDLLSAIENGSLTWKRLSGATE